MATIEVQTGIESAVAVSSNLALDVSSVSLHSNTGASSFTRVSRFI